jgi:SAM-dependent methyltransferase
LSQPTPPPIFILDDPQYHEIQPGTEQRFRGVVLSLDGPRIVAIEVTREGKAIAGGPVNIATPELAGLPADGSASCRFEFPVRLDERPATVVGRCADGSAVTLFHYEPPAAEMARMRRVAERVLALPFPPPELVATTQGGTNVKSYANSAVSGLFTLRALLRRSGHDPEGVRSVLDVGCGTGRSLVGWHCDDPSRLLTGVDINADLIAWASEALNDVSDWRVSNVTPPLDLPGGTFDVIQLASVFTHLPLPLQHDWLAELQRLLKPSGSLVISLHGAIYVRLMLDATAREGFDAAGGYAEFAAAAPGANAFSTFHSRAFAERMFLERFGEVHWFPRGDVAEHPSLFPFAALQDVWVCRAPRAASR